MLSKDRKAIKIWYLRAHHICVYWLVNSFVCVKGWGIKKGKSIKRFERWRRNWYLQVSWRSKLDLADRSAKKHVLKLKIKRKKKIIWIIHFMFLPIDTRRITINWKTLSLKLKESRRCLREIKIGCNRISRNGWKSWCSNAKLSLNQRSSSKNNFNPCRREITMQLQYFQLHQCKNLVPHLFRCLNKCNL